MSHTLIALALQAIIAIPSGNWWAGAAAGAFYFIGREMAQAEDRYIDANGGRRYMTPKRPEIAALHPRWWNRKSVLDWALPSIAVVTVAFMR